MAGDLTIGANVRAAREAAGVQQDELERSCGLPRSSMSRIESGERAIKATELAAIAAGLGVSALGLLEPDSFTGSLALAARSTQGLVGPGSVRTLLVELADLHQVLDEAGIPAKPEIADAPSDGSGWLATSNRLASWARLQMGEVPPTVDGLAASIETVFGVDVMIDDHGGSLIGASIVSAEFPFIFVDSTQPPRRALFTLAHELGHIVAGGTPGIHEDQQLGGNDRERSANAFAAALLMPEDSVRGIIAEYGRGADSLGHMLRSFGVSYESLVYRLHNVGIIDAAGRDALRGLTWNALITRVSDVALREFLASEQAAGSLGVQRPPTLLLERAWRGYESGAVSLRPYARLIGVETDALLAQLDQADEILEAPAPLAVNESDDARYADDPFLDDLV